MSMKKTKMNHKKALALLGIAAAVAYTTPNMMSLGSAHASGGGSGGFFNGGSQPRGFGSGAGGFNITDQVTATECGDCHQPYGADALPQGSWRRMMGDLSNHFGEDASLDDQTRNHITNYLVSNSPPGDGPLRITETGWFRSEHRGEARLRQGGKWMNCNDCHRSRGSWQPRR
jgi:hypothetical protein